MRTYLLIQAFIFFLIALKLLKTSDDRSEALSKKAYSVGLDLKTTPSNVYQLKRKGPYANRRS
jgi:hypothetical protein